VISATDSYSRTYSRFSRPDIYISIYSYVYVSYAVSKLFESRSCIACVTPSLLGAYAQRKRNLKKGESEDRNNTCI
jgi:hypothetical protein